MPVLACANCPDCPACPGDQRILASLPASDSNNDEVVILFECHYCLLLRTARRRIARDAAATRDDSSLAHVLGGSSV